MKTAARSRLEDITRFLASHRLAEIGVSRDPKEFSRLVMRELEQRGYEVVPVRPAAEEIAGKPCFARVQDIQPPVAAALVLTSPAITDNIVRDCVAAGVGCIWVRRNAEGCLTPATIALCRERGVNLIAGECPLMFLPRGAFPHRLHGAVRKLFGAYPR